MLWIPAALWPLVGLWYVSKLGLCNSPEICQASGALEQWLLLILVLAFYTLERSLFGVTPTLQKDMITTALGPSTLEEARTLLDFRRLREYRSDVLVHFSPASGQ